MHEPKFNSSFEFSTSSDVVRIQDWITYVHTQHQSYIYILRTELYMFGLWSQNPFWPCFFSYFGNCCCFPSFFRDFCTIYALFLSSAIRTTRFTHDCYYMHALRRERGERISRGTCAAKGTWPHKMPFSGFHTLCSGCIVVQGTLAKMRFAFLVEMRHSSDTFFPEFSRKECISRVTLALAKRLEALVRTYCTTLLPCSKL